jgi:pectin methylesterase-like acyl-CoA thioesterase
MLHTRCWATAAATVISIGLPGLSVAATLSVPGDFATIQACIDAAVSDEDECVVAPGTYHEKINFLNKAIAVRSSGGADVTTIDATGLNASVVTCSSGEGPDTALDGFAITGGTGMLIGVAKYGGGMLNSTAQGKLKELSGGER